jgi:hypothetical protein
MLFNNFFINKFALLEQNRIFKIISRNPVCHILHNQLLFIQRFKVFWFAASHPALFLLSSAQKYSIGQV